ncbi:hypothetical protein KZ483_17280 [Paenibacillus sp. sptzw28]|uniref:hypothetical protein n=1 Tax=Paenibacillus sp. sptzw28 TaxID=715179 RepID=UPI001C6E208F|nr:hypothetical protein [Paenibacillus sp. sptzw28]QYR19643.1 hypothetical protein KZ483_17280 [Paenibacillus sp. sptzw28]
MKFRQINQNTEEDFQDLEFDIVEFQRRDDRNYFRVYGQYKDEIVGFDVLINSDLIPGWDNGDINRDAFSFKGITLKSIGKESDAFLKVLLELYGFNGELQFEDEISFTCFPLEGDPRNIAFEDIKFKVFFDDNDEMGLYCEAYMNVSVKSYIFEFKEKDTEYRENILRTLSK